VWSMRRKISKEVTSCNEAEGRESETNPSAFRHSGRRNSCGARSIGVDHILMCSRRLSMWFCLSLFGYYTYVLNCWRYQSIGPKLTALQVLLHREREILSVLIFI
jgi:hypothetical protein